MPNLHAALDHDAALLQCSVQRSGCVFTWLVYRDTQNLGWRRQRQRSPNPHLAATWLTLHVHFAFVGATP